MKAVITLSAKYPDEAVEIARLLLEKGTDINQRTGWENRTALKEARSLGECERGLQPIIELLKEHRAME